VAANRFFATARRARALRRYRCRCGWRPARGRSPLFLLFAGEALRNIEGERYDAWNAAVRSFLTASQVKEGALAGRWDPAIFGGEGDRVWATACAALCLQSHFRYLPFPKAEQAARSQASACRAPPANRLACRE